MAQNFKNHKRYSIPFHFMTMPVILTAFGTAIYAYTRYPDLLHGLMALAFLLIGILAFFARTFALRVQDRAARADERLRYFILTGKRLPEQLRMSQILALRFASDEEFVDLVDRVLFDKLSSKEIKQAIIDWRADHYRV
ncbi:hypothetical protein D9M68_701940 [compost metagenome]